LGVSRWPSPVSPWSGVFLCHTVLSPHLSPSFSFPLFFFTATATTEIYTLSLHDALPISYHIQCLVTDFSQAPERSSLIMRRIFLDRKSTRLNSSHQIISYAVFCLKKKIKPNIPTIQPTR